MPRFKTPATHRTRLTASARRALEMLATDFATEKIMIDRGFTRRLLIWPYEDQACDAVQQTHKSRRQRGSRHVHNDHSRGTASAQRVIGAFTHHQVAHYPPPPGHASIIGGAVCPPALLAKALGKANIAGRVATETGTHHY